MFYFSALKSQRNLYVSIGSKKYKGKSSRVKWIGKEYGLKRALSRGKYL
jgi:hypothetical protein